MNRLAEATSPYLQQHADNPVDWYPWGDEALERAAREDKPILLSIGYSACHWCHVMAHESFERADIAALMNAHFVNIKVDREERPDLDRIYQVAHQLLTRNRGGWPLTMFLTPEDHLPFFGGTYFPPRARHGMPGFDQVLERVAAVYAGHGDDIDQAKPQMRAALAQVLGGADAPGELDQRLAGRACADLLGGFDATHGGFGAAPKFPHPSGLELLLEDVGDTGDATRAARLHAVDYTLEAMARGGLYDHLGGGFCRYSVDERWDIPHFEKMLYDNGSLLALYARRAAVTGHPLFAEVAHTTADWLLDVMRTPQGAFCSSLDADSEGEEGRFYVWNRNEVSALLGERYAAFAARYGLDGPANFEGRWHLRLAPPGSGDDDGSAFLGDRERLRESRAERPWPARDDKILTAWNALAIKGLIAAGVHLGRCDCIDAACAAVDFLRAHHWRDGRLLATSRDGHAHLGAYLDDHAFLLDALLALLAARWRSADLTFAIELAELLLDRFADHARGGFYFTADDHEQLIERSRSFSDDSLPAGNAVAASALAELARLVGDTRYAQAARDTLAAGMPEAAQLPAACATLLRALLDDAAPPAHVVLRPRNDDLPAPWRDALRSTGDARLRAYVVPATTTTLPGLLAAQRPLDDAEVTAYACRGTQCSAPLTAARDLAEVLDQTLATG
ncbi:MAG: thioredoxin domain-containing protein [Gammaproteobacteria bacterium]